MEAGLARLQSANATPNAIFCTPTVYALLRGDKDLQGRRHLAPDPSAAAARAIFGVPVYVTTNLPNTETVGTAEDTSPIVIADTSQIVVAMGGPQIAFSEQAGFECDMIGVRAIVRADVGVANIAAVEVLSSALAEAA